VSILISIVLKPCQNYVKDATKHYSDWALHQYMSYECSIMLNTGTHHLRGMPKLHRLEHLVGM